MKDSVVDGHPSPCHLCSTSDFHIKICKNNNKTRTYIRFVRSNNAAIFPFFLCMHKHTLVVGTLGRKRLKSRRKTLHVSLKSPPGIKAHTVPQRLPERRGFHHERGRGTLRAIYVHVLLSYDAVRFEEEHSNRICLFNDVQQTLFSLGQHSEKWSMKVRAWALSLCDAPFGMIL